MNIGKLWHRVEIQTFTENQNPQGYETTKEWLTLKTVWADVRPVSGLVTFDTRQVNEAITHKVYIRYTNLVSTENWLLLRGHRLRIRSVVDLDMRGQFLELLCEDEGVDL